MTEADAMLAEAARATARDQDFTPFLVLADWYADRGESRLEGACRWVARFGKRPGETSTLPSQPRYWYDSQWYSSPAATSRWEREWNKHCVVPTALFDRMLAGGRQGDLQEFILAPDVCEAYRRLLDAWDFDVAEVEGPVFA